MIAVAKIGGHQAIVSVGDTLEVDKLSAEVGETIKFDTLLVSEEDGKDFQLGTPFLNGIQVEAKIIEHARGAKIRVFKMKPRKRYRRLRGHRQNYTVIEITSLGLGGAAKKAAAPKKEAAKEDKKAPAKKPAAKKPAAKKVAKTEEKK